MASNLSIVISAKDSASGPIGAVTRALQGMGSAATAPIKGLIGLGSAVGDVGVKIMGLGAMTGVLAGLAAPFTGVVGAASDMAESTSKAEVVFGKSAEGVKAFAKTSAQSMGLSSQAATEMAGTFGNLFTSMGLGQEASAGMSIDVLKLGSDLASFNNIPVDEALEKIRSGLVGESEPLRSLGVNLTEAAVGNKALTMGLDMSTDAAAASAKVQARYALILEQSKNAQGDFARTSNGMANAQRIISASFKDLRMAIGQRLLPVIAPLISAFAQGLPAAFDKIMPIVDEVGRAFQSLPEKFGPVIAAAQNAFDGAKRAFQLGGWGGVAKFVGDGLLAEWAKIDWGAIWRSVQGAAASTFASIGSIVTNVTTWLGDQWAGINWGEVWKKAKDVGAAIGAGIGSIVASVTAWIGDQWAGIKWGEVWAKVKNVASEIGAGLGSIVTSVTTWLGDQWASINWPEVWARVQQIGASLATALGTIKSEIQAWFLASWNSIDWPTTMANANKITISARDMIDTQAVGEEIGKGIVKAVVITMAMPLYWLAGAMGFGNALKGGIQPGTQGKAVGEELAKGIVSGIKSELNLQFAPLGAWIRENLKISIGPLSLSTSGIKFQPFGNPADVPGTPEIGGGAGVIGYAEGGLVPGPVGAAQMAVVHGGERVLTPEQQQGGPVSIVCNFYGRTDSAAARDGVLSAARSLGLGVA